MAGAQMIKSPSIAKRVMLSGLYLDRNRRPKPSDMTRSNKGGGFNECQGMVGEVALQNEPIGRHNPHHALDLIARKNSADPIVPYTAATTIASTLLGRYPGS